MSNNYCGNCASTNTPQNRCGAPPPPSPACPAEMGNRPRAAPQYIYGPKICTVAEDDTLPIPYPRTAKKVRINTLGSPIGLVKSSAAPKADDSQMQRFATCLKAFARIYLTPENEWTTKAVDKLIKEGEQLVSESNKAVSGDQENEEPNLEVYLPEESKVKKAFDCADYLFEIELNKKYELKPSPVEKNGDEPTPNLTIEYLKPALKAFFRQAKYCLAMIETWYLLIWKSRGVYFVFDFNGRKPTDFVADRDSGIPMLICLKEIENVLHLILNLSDVKPTDQFSLRELKLIKLVSPDGQTKTRDHGPREQQWEVVSDDFAYVLASLHLTLNRADPLRNRSALPVNIAALITSKIDHPGTWNQRTLDRIICYGVNLCRSCWEPCLDLGKPINLNHFPNQLKIGQFLVTFELTPKIFEGTWKCVPNFKHTELTVAIEKSFESCYNSILLQIDNQMYAIWKKNSFIYLFDPYRHRINAGPSSDNPDEKSAALRMFRSLDTFLPVFNQILLESTRTNHFFIHKLKVKKIELAKPTEGSPTIEAGQDEEAEVQSLNEAVCFIEDEAQCLAELGEISDYEDEDLTGVIQVDTKEPKSESDETEEDMEEEEGGAEDLGEYESSSSGDGDGRSSGRKKKGKKGRSSSGRKSKPRKSQHDKDKSKGKGKGKKQKGRSDDEKKRKSKKSKSKKEKPVKEKKEKPVKEKKKKSVKEKKEKPVKEKKEKPVKEKKEKPVKEKPEKEPPVKRPTETDTAKRGTEVKQQRDPSIFGKDDRKSAAESIRNRDPSAVGGGTGGKSWSEFDDDSTKDTMSCRPNNYPGYSPIAHDMAVVGTESGSYDSICKLLRAGFKCADRVLTMTAWGNYVVFRGYRMLQRMYFLFDGCTCNVNRFRHLDLNVGTAGLLCFQNLHDTICYIIDSQKIRTSLQKSRKNIVDEICQQYCK